MKKSTAFGLALAALAMSPVLAQTPSQTMPMRGMMGGGCAMMGMMGQGMMGQGMMGGGQAGAGRMGQGRMQGQARMESMAEGRLAFLKAELKITAEQEAAWTGYADAVKGRVAAMKDMRGAMMEAMQSGSAVERMDARISGMEAMVAALKEIKPATEALYAALNEDQKELADQLIGGDCGAM